MPIQKHEHHIAIDENTTLWRYMSFTKYKSLLETNSLFFCRADKFSDPYECSIPKKEYEFRLSPEKFADEERLFNRTDSKFDLENAKKKAEGIAATHQKFRTATTVNCWHINNNESDAMWQLYLKDNEGIAVRTNAKKLYKSFQNTKEKIGISKVRYINYDTDVWFHATDFPIAGYNFYTPIIHKKIEFIHEKELRLYHHINDREKAGYWDTQKIQGGELITVEVSTLVESIIFHPTADQAAKDQIISLTKAYGHDFKFESSRLSIDPYY